MTCYSSFIYPLLNLLEAEQAHGYALAMLEWAQRSAAGRAVLRLLAGPMPQCRVQVFGLTFPNVLGVAAGFDKDIRVAGGLALLGFGHIEVGTLTPRPQAGNPRPRLFRLPQHGALINRMGFPNCGVEAAVPRLRALTENKRDFIVGVSLGKQRETPLAEAVSDYVTVMQAVYPYADYLAVNVSSPNTPGLRALQLRGYLEVLLDRLWQAGEKMAVRYGVPVRPLLVKIAPDLNPVELDEVVAAVEATGVSGIIATNTTLSRQGVSHRLQHEAGGLSGRPLVRRSTEVIAYIYRQTGGRLPIIGAGGVRAAADVRAKLEAGASLVQLYTGLVYEGPRIAGHILRTMAGDTPRCT